MSQNELEKTLGKVIDEKITPKLKRIEEKLDATMEMTAKNSEDITMLRQDFTDMGFTIERVETKLDSTIRNQDDTSVRTSQLARRTLRLETKIKAKH